MSKTKECIQCGTVFSRNPRHTYSYWATVKCCSIKCSSFQRIKHGMTNTPEFYIWRGIRARCENQKNISWDNYGGRGIAVCQRWSESFNSFILDMGPRPSSKHSVDRRDNDGPYSPENCYWATRSQQQSNKRTTIWVELNGERICLSEAARRVKIPRPTIETRMKFGLTFMEAITPPRYAKEPLAKRTMGISRP